MFSLDEFRELESDNLRLIDDLQPSAPHCMENAIDGRQFFFAQGGFQEGKHQSLAIARSQTALTPDFAK
jgi:hypothetical protein